MMTEYAIHIVEPNASQHFLVIMSVILLTAMCRIGLVSNAHCIMWTPII